MAEPTIEGRTLEYKDAPNGNVEAFMKEADGMVATNPTAKFIKTGATEYVCKSCVTDEEITVKVGTLAEGKTALVAYLRQEGLYPVA